MYTMYQYKEIFKKFINQNYRYLLINKIELEQNYIQ